MSSNIKKNIRIFYLKIFIFYGKIFRVFEKACFRNARSSGPEQMRTYTYNNRHKTLRKHAYSNILKILPPENENFEIKISDIFHISAQNIDCGYSIEPSRRGGSNEYPQSMFLSRTKINNVYPCKPQFYYIKVRFMGGQNYIGMFS